MGVSPPPDIAQEIMEQVLASLLEEIEVYLDDIAAFSDDWESHLVLLEKLLMLNSNGVSSKHTSSVGTEYAAVYDSGTCKNLTAKSFQSERLLLFLGSTNQ